MNIQRLSKLAGIQLLSEETDKPHIEITKGGTTAGISSDGLFVSIDGKTAEAIAEILGIPKDGTNTKVKNGFCSFTKDGFLLFSKVERDLDFGADED